MDIPSIEGPSSLLSSLKLINSVQVKRGCLCIQKLTVSRVCWNERVFQWDVQSE